VGAGIVAKQIGLWGFGVQRKISSGAWSNSRGAHNVGDVACEEIPGRTFLSCESGGGRNWLRHARRWKPHVALELIHHIHQPTQSPNSPLLIHKALDTQGVNWSNISSSFITANIESDDQHGGHVQCRSSFDRARLLIRIDTTIAALSTKTAWLLPVRFSLDHL
jgi:hypothetical protein